MIPLIFERGRPGRRARVQAPVEDPDLGDIPAALRRRDPPRLAEVSELDAVRHYTRLAQRNFSIDTHFYPLGSCTMKYNPRGANRVASLPEFLELHPLAPEDVLRGYLICLLELQDMLAVLTGMKKVVLGCMAGAQGEFAGVSIIRAYHHARGDHGRRVMLVPDAAHGTNPASAAMAGFTVREIPTRSDGDVDLEALSRVLGPETAGIMLTNPSTLGVFERRIVELARRVHAAGGLLYYDGANLNAILGQVRPGDMGFDVLHLNLHKTFSTPHGGGGPGAAALGVNERLLPFLPHPFVVDDPKTGPRWSRPDDAPRSIGRLAAFHGNAGVLLRAWAYARMLGREGLRSVGPLATLNANYLARRLSDLGYELAYPTRRAGHEFLVTLRREAKTHGITAMDVAKRLLDHGIHAPTTYFPLLVPECLLIEPTETESRETLDAFVEAMAAIRREMSEDPERLRGAPWTTPVRRLDEVRAARQLDLAWKPGQPSQEETQSAR